ncbi:MAG: site-specific DNA-methyltransferase [Candidatus Cloacimonetes bacterium]|nr:site-specific DNA-methyltransferase [Candidatus Cloacimonadota bacterium]
MTTAERLRAKLMNKLKELFQLSQPDLDFGFYRIMNTKAEEIANFIDHDLLQEISDAFQLVDEAQRKKLQDAVEEEIKNAKEYGVQDPENSPKVLEAKKQLEAAKDTASTEADIYDHLYRFFERYYDNGDFITRRYYTRETPGKAAPFAIPYNGEEVKLHWANSDQYYIKTTEHFSNYSFNLALGIQKLRSSDTDKEDILQKAVFEDTDLPSKLNVTFRIVDATEGEHGNIKSTDDGKRFFIIHHPQPVELTDAGELIINFEYRSDPQKTSQESTWRDAKNIEAVETIFKALDEMPEAKDFLRGFQHKAPTEKKKDRILLEKYIYQYTTRNTRDYFIHKNLGAFLKRELNFYIKNEVMRLDDIEHSTAPKVEDYLAKIKVLRKIATKLIEFLAQLEDFQKKLWLKKKFIVETNYCITLDRVPEELYPQIIENEAQHEEWIKLFAIDEIEGDALTPAYSKPLSLDFLKANNKLVLDTRFFDEAFTAKLISSIQDFDELCDGLLIHSENFQALNMLQERYREQVKCVYIDPPYNTAASEIIYKNEYKHSSWLSLIQDRIALSIDLGLRNSFYVTAIDHEELFKLGVLKDDIFCEDNRIALVTVQHNPKGRNQAKFFSENSDFMLVYAKDINEAVFNNVAIDEEVQLTFTNKDEAGKFRYEHFLRARTSWSRANRPLNWYPIYVSKDLSDITDQYHNDYYEVFPVTKQGEFSWKNIKSTFVELNKNGYFKAEYENGAISILHKYREDQVLKNVWIQKKYQSEFNGTNLLKNILGESLFDYPKSIYTIIDIYKIMSKDYDLALDYFAGSGTTGHAVINLNREDEGSRKYILVEMGDYFDTVLKPRICKVVYSQDWKDGKPQNRDTGISHCVKYLRLESYEDTLNNLVLKSDPIRDQALGASDGIKEDYMLNYLLDVESRGSQSLLNIDAFADPTRYLLKVKKPGSDEYVERAVDLIETFNYLIGLRLLHLAEPQTFAASFVRLRDPDLPQDQNTRLVLDGDLKQAPGGKWWIRKVEGWVPKNPYNPNDGLKEKVLIVWRKLTGNLEEDNLVLDTWFQKNRISTYDWEFDTIYVNGSNNLPNLRLEGDTWKVRLIEEEFMKRMWNLEEV